MQGKPQTDYSRALPVVIRIMDKWGCNAREQMQLLGICSRSTLNRYKAAPSGLRLRQGTLERMGYILSIHKSLRLLFCAEDSVYGWVRKPNQHPFFAGRSALEVMMGGRVADLHEVSQRLKAWQA